MYLLWSADALKAKHLIGWEKGETSDWLREKSVLDWWESPETRIKQKAWWCIVAFIQYMNKGNPMFSNRMNFRKSPYALWPPRRFRKVVLRTSRQDCDKMRMFTWRNVCVHTWEQCRKKLVSVAAWIVGRLLQKYGRFFFNKVLPSSACIYPKPGWKLSEQPRHCPDNNIQ